MTSAERAARWRAKHPERARALVARWHKANPDKVKANAARYRRAHPEVAREAAARRRRASPEKSRAAAARYRRAHPDRVKSGLARWRRANRDVGAAHGAARRARERAATPVLTVFERAQVLGAYAVARARSVQTGVKHHVDHIVPLARGGQHHPSNLQVLTAEENLRKWVW